ncbi:anthranilate synthase family protein (plasmid) [Embleya sp. NBC_00888]|uniref:anthranilate synthase family protein n=1 Tax=Embleya sp. NBC_00888 TaxID=2975960 RepID=UPI002F916F2F|nr:anthranilate synthase family protein [Embleya sp. NBC_00888]
MQNLLTDEDPPPFALLYRPESCADVEILTGTMTTAGSLVELQRTPSRSGAAHDLLVVVPYRQITERGFDCPDDSAPLLAMRVEAQGAMSVREALRHLPDEPVGLADGRFDIQDDDYADIVRRVLANEIGRGEGSNFVIKRSYTGSVDGDSVRAALAVFARLLTVEQGAYWTFIVHTGARTFVGASPERHISLAAGEVVMNPISGTLRYPPAGVGLSDVLRFLSDTKETDELYMVLDEELKMMARICPTGATVTGPRLKEMARLAHTEYLLEGKCELDPREILRETLFAPTVTGSPLESAFRVIKRYEPTGRGYYGGVLAVLGRDERGEEAMDSAILIRTGELDRSGRLRAGVGATLVRHSDPDSEVAETEAKLAGLLSAFNVGPGEGTGTPATPSPARPRLARHPLVRRELRQRNADLARFWLEPPERRGYAAPELDGRRVLVIDAEDAFTAMLGHQLSALGLAVEIRRFDEAEPVGGHDLVVLGPGPGDPRRRNDPKIARLRATAAALLRDCRPVLAVCLSHQVLSGHLGLDLVRRSVPNQGVRRTIDYFGVPRTVGFYNSFTAVSNRDRLSHRDVPGVVEISRDMTTGEVHALRGPCLRSIQFHAESVLSPDGLGILRDLVGELVSADDDSRAGPV